MRIKVTGYIDTQDLEPGEFDPTHKYGLSAEGYERVISELSDALDDLDFELEGS